MELKQIKELMTAMERARIKKLSIENKGFKIELEREGEPSSAGMVGQFSAPTLEHMEMHKMQGLLANLTRLGGSPLSPLVHEKVKESSPVASSGEEETTGLFITSPMVGTFYATPSPNDPAYVKEGEKIEIGKVVCVIEAMKVMNEVKSTLSGVILDVLVENGQPIEFGTKLFRISAV